MRQTFEVFWNGVSWLNSVNRQVRYGAIALISLLLIIAVYFGLHPRQTFSPIPIALVAPVSGEEAIAGEEMVHSVQMYLDTVNQTGGINGHLLKLLTFDDQADEDVAKQRAPEIVSSPAVVLLGHRSSAPSEAGAQAYQSAHLPTITGTATTDSLTLDHPYYFRNTYTRSDLNAVLGVYANLVLKINTATVIQYEKYGKKLAQEFEATFTKSGGKIKRKLTIDSDPKQKEQSIQVIVDTLAADPNPGIIYLSLRGEKEAEILLVAIKRRGLKLPVMLSQPLSREDFANRFESYPEEQEQPGFFTNSIYATAPLLFDSAGVDAQEFADTYHKLYGKAPSYVGTKYYESAILAVEAIRNANLQATINSRDSDRQQVYAALKQINNRNVAPRGPTGPLYFNTTRDSDQPVRVAQFQKRTFVSAPQQFETIFNPERVNVPRELKAGTIVQIGDTYFWRQTVVYTGIDINKLNRVDQQSSSFTADFYLWFRYVGEAGLNDIEFPGGVNPLPKQPLFDPAKPSKSYQLNGVNYRLYQLQGEFENSFELRDYPFDQQKLTIRLQNHRIPSDRLIYATDTFGLQLPRSTTDAERYSSSLWEYKGIRYAKETARTTSTEGDPRLFDANNRVDYPGLSATITVQRRPLAVLGKVVPPLLLLALVPLMTLYFSEKIVKERAAVTVAALIAGTVLLANAYRQLPEVGYTVRLEYLYYVFFGLSLFSIWIAIISDHLSLSGRKVMAKRLDRLARVLYVATMLAVGYWLAFGGRV